MEFLAEYRDVFAAVAEGKLNDLQPDQVPAQLKRLQATFSLADAEMRVLVRIVASQLDADCLQREAQQSGLDARTLLGGLSLRTLLQGPETDASVCWATATRLLQRGLLDCDPAQRRQYGLLDTPLRPADRALYALLGRSGELSPELQECCTLVPLAGPVPANAAGHDAAGNGTLAKQDAGALAPLAREQIERLTIFFQNGGRPPERIHLQGAPGAGQREAAQALARALGRPLLVLDTEAARRNPAEDLNALFEAARREALFLEAILLLDASHDAGFANGEDKTRKQILDALARMPRPTFLAGRSDVQPAELSRTGDALILELALPEHAERLRRWESVLNGRADESLHLPELARTYRLTPGQIEAALRQAGHRAAALRDDARIQESDLAAACRTVQITRLPSMAEQVHTKFDWDDLILPEERLLHLREICERLKERIGVFEEWGFGEKLAYGFGTHALFHGVSGTGKTMAAAIIARELKLDLYKIDLSQVVSKYIGETEKNLSRIFHEAEQSHAILFFDEADALFGKRTDVKDAHDRYANIETSYLLQEMERYEGVSILASNLQENMDKAFLRRLHFIVEFPFPGEDERLRLWKSFLPKQAPLTDDVNLEFLAKRIKMAGGSLKNIMLNAAFYARSEGQPIAMPHLIRAVKREYKKENLPFISADFRQYAYEGV